MSCGTSGALGARKARGQRQRDRRLLGCSARRGAGNIVVQDSVQPRAVEQFAGIQEVVEEHEQIVDTPALSDVKEHVFKVFSQDKVQQREVHKEVPRGAGGRLSSWRVGVGTQTGD